MIVGCITDVSRFRCLVSGFQPQTCGQGVQILVERASVKVVGCRFAREKENLVFLRFCWFCWFRFTRFRKKNDVLSENSFQVKNDFYSQRHSSRRCTALLRTPEYSFVSQETMG